MNTEYGSCGSEPTTSSEIDSIIIYSLYAEGGTIARRAPYKRDGKESADISQELEC